MSSTKDKIRDWFFALPEETRNQIDDIVEQIREKEEFIETHEQSLRELVRNLVRMLEPLIDDPSQTSVIIKAIANGRISDDTIERALPEEKKRKHKPYETYQQLEQNRLAEFQRPVTVSSSGSQSVTDPEGNEREQEIEQMAETTAAENIYHNNVDSGGFTEREVIPESEVKQAEIIVLKKRLEDKEVRLKEAFSIMEDREKRILQLELQIGELEVQFADMKKNPPKMDNKGEEDIHIKYDELKQAYEELRAVEALRTKQQDFKPASQVKSPPIAYVNKIDFSSFSRVVLGINLNLTSDKGRVLFDLTDDGQLKNPRPEREGAM